MAAEPYPERSEHPTLPRPVLLTRVATNPAEASARLTMMDSFRSFLAQKALQNRRPRKNKIVEPDVELATTDFAQTQGLAHMIRLFAADSWSRTLHTNSYIRQLSAQGSVGSLRQQALAKHLDAFFVRFGTQPPAPNYSAYRYLVEYHKKAQSEMDHYPEINLISWLGSQLLDDGHEVAGYASSVVVATAGHSLYATSHFGRFDVPDIE